MRYTVLYIFWMLIIYGACRAPKKENVFLKVILSSDTLKEGQEIAGASYGEGLDYMIAPELAAQDTAFVKRFLAPELSTDAIASAFLFFLDSHLKLSDSTYALVWFQVALQGNTVINLSTHLQDGKTIDKQTLMDDGDWDAGSAPADDQLPKLAYRLTYLEKRVFEFSELDVSEQTLKVISSDDFAIDEAARITNVGHYSATTEEMLNEANEGTLSDTKIGIFELGKSINWVLAKKKYESWYTDELTGNTVFTRQGKPVVAVRESNPSSDGALEMIETYVDEYPYTLYDFKVGTTLQDLARISSIKTIHCYGEEGYWVSTQLPGYLFRVNLDNVPCNENQELPSEVFDLEKLDTCVITCIQISTNY